MEGAAVLVGNKDYDSDTVIQRLLKKALSLSFYLVIIELVQEAAIGSCIKSVI
jgi:hypothetical protein